MTRESLSFGGDADLARAIDRACDRFAEALQSGAEPRIEDFLAEAPADVRDLLLQELLPLELEAHLQRGRTLQQTAYLTRFPQAREIVEKVFHQATTSEATLGSTADLPVAPTDLRPGAAPDPEQNRPPFDDHAPAVHRAPGPVPQRPSAARRTPPAAVTPDPTRGRPAVRAPSSQAKCPPGSVAMPSSRSWARVALPWSTWPTIRNWIGSWQ